MRKFKPNEYEAFKKICGMRQETLRRSLVSILKDKYEDVIETPDYIYAIGTDPITLVAHMDTVFRTPAQEIYYDREKNVCWSPQGLGADDRAGVYAIIHLLKSKYRPSIIFTTDEEKGCIGAGKLIANIPMAMDASKYIIQLDRRGHNDCVFYDCENEEFEKYVETFGFETAIGSFSDISIICPAWKVAGVNLSIGYFGEHSQTEILNVGYMFETLGKVILMLADAENSKSYEYVEADYSKWYNAAYGKYLYGDETPGEAYAWGDYDYGYGYKDDRVGYGPYGSIFLKCHKCQKTFDEYEIFGVKCKDGKTHYMCPDCIVDDSIEWCKICGEPFELDGPEDKSTICHDCKRGLKY